ncbi:dihydrodipicolinate synthase family protein [Streptomyces sp. SPB162]|uniref:dihydrodipicolinate synthase family protein n=1 Tax=Streptomyces sp. SPB162 TaxID=2940560 RepID=UPI00240584FE|nr:dihydrodipicolinate synthase family protein [Streptomyces sp. SPB162]MDF9810978.1 4-hydroxy-tetrahydrodipicolinate synthase [Streptomyces sp. SPB162]
MDRTELTHPAELRAALADVVAIPVTPFDADGAIDRTAYRSLLRRLLDGGVRTLTPNGNTGEFYALTPEERLTVVEDTLAETAQRPAVVLVGVGHDVPTAVAAARHARDHGAQMVMVHQPVHPYVSHDGWVDYHRAIAESVPELGVVPYIRNPLLGGDRMALLGDLCPNVIGAKYAVPDAARFAAFARDAGLDRFVWVAGLAELYAPAYWGAGATGFTSGLVNVAPSVSLGMLTALRAGDYSEAMRIWEQIRPFEDLRAAQQSANNVTVVKEALAALGLCRREVRPPSRELPDPQRAEVAALIKGWAL